ncbi:hypothetical protein B7494_g6514 [Chlorociboria aeruginascens]|nr:hypothetical protein B7494_g6514 [Chlorociboria aeruginascens]
MTSRGVTKTLKFRTPNSDLEVVIEELKPIPANEILIKVHAASINPVDVQIWRSQLIGRVAGQKQMGRDFSGTVVEVGSSVKGWAEGEDIFGMLVQVFGQGTFAEHIHLDPSKEPVVKKPSCLSHEAAAALPLVVLTDFAILDWLPPPTTSQRKVIVQGASGGTGSWVVQLAKHVYDCHVTAICSAKNADYVKRLGADEVIDYTTEFIPQALLERHFSSPKSDLIVDCVGGMELLDVYPQILHPKGAYVTIVGDKTSTKSLGGPLTYVTHPAQILRFIKGWIWGPRYACVSYYTRSDLLQKVVGLAERGEADVEIQEVVEGCMDEELQGWKRAIELIEKTVQQVLWNIPDGNLSDLSQTFTNGAVLPLSWNSFASTAYVDTIDNLVNLWVTSFDYSHNPFSALLKENLNMTFPGTFSWNIAIPEPYLGISPEYVLRFTLPVTSYNPSLGNLASPGFLILGAASESTSTNASSNSPPTNSTPTKSTPANSAPPNSTPPNPNPVPTKSTATSSTATTSTSTSSTAAYFASPSTLGLSISVSSVQVSPSTSLPNTQSSSPMVKASTGLTGGAKAGIGIGAALVICSLVGAGIYAFMRAKRRQTAPPPPPPPPLSDYEKGNSNASVSTHPTYPPEMAYTPVVSELWSADGGVWELPGGRI